MKILIDMNLSPRWQKFLTEAGLQAAHWSELGEGDASDLDIMAYAQAHDYVVLTHDLDFAAILAATHGKKPSVVQIRAEQLAPDVIGSHIVSALRQLAVELDSGALVTVEPKRTRMRVLPLREQSS
jgi:predicted nuclease of predicted toxin-antitoxin system